MANTLYISATAERSGKSAITLGLMRLLIGRVGKVGFFRPIIEESSGFDHELQLISEYFGLNLPQEQCYAFTLEEARRLINTGQVSVLMDKILDTYNKLASQYDFILCQGTDFLGKHGAFELELNADIASTLGVPVLLVHPSIHNIEEEIRSSAISAVEVFAQRGIEIAALVVNRVDAELVDIDTLKNEIASQLTQKNAENPLVYFIPENNILGRPSLRDVAKNFNAEVLFCEQNLIDYHVDDYLIAAMHLGNFLNFLQEGNLVVTPGDRDDVLMGSIVASMSKTFPSISGILLTGGLKPSPSIIRLLEGMRNMSIPVLAVKTNTTETIDNLKNLRDRIAPDDTRKVHTALGNFDRYIDSDELAKRIVDDNTSRMTPRMFEYKLMEQARKHPMRIVLPEGTEDRILRAAEALQARQTAKIILLGDTEAILQKARSMSISLEGIEIINPAQSPNLQDYAETYAELRKKKGITLEEAQDRMLDTTYFGTMMVYKDDADGLVSGSVNTTANTVRPALEFIKTKPGFSIVSSTFLMCLKDRVLAFGDCAINPDPTAEQLADIAITSSETARIFGVEPRVAMLSYSTGTSGKGEDVDKVKEATKIAHERAPELSLEGPLQYDAAIDPEVAKTKMPDSPVAGKATVFIFPDLNTGNNTYKAVQRAADAIAIGPILQGLRKPVNDLSRGCTVPDIINTVAITAIQAQAEKGLI